MNPLWKSYKSKVLKTINPEYEEDAAEEKHLYSVDPDLRGLKPETEAWLQVLCVSDRDDSQGIMEKVQIVHRSVEERV
uniref:Uncharacterized protein n=1 Tax=Knipowitschia caucasica TaxID=637954 RepID=A0AAV2MA02_KNICA